ncbi:hypothetical protein HY498_04210 [Candidatus Woesearchaeota archaeon]|nr:hypothetical protein [Candidatus Woesearchaeota archaeon]
MLKRGFKDVIVTILTYIAYVIGAGIFGIPYVVSKVGFLYGALVLIIVGIAVLLTHLMIGEIALSCKGSHQLVGYCQKFLGEKLKWLMLFNVVLWVYGALLAYITGVSDVLANIFGGSNIFYALITWFILSLLLLAGITLFEEIETIFTFVMLIALLTISFISIYNLKFSNLTYLNPSNLSLFKLLFFPYGVILFSLLGESAIPTMRDELQKHKIFLKNSILIGGIVVIIVYFLFALGVVGVTGLETTQVATIGLNIALGKWAWLFGNLFAIFAMSTSFLALGFALKNTYNRDLKLGKILSWALVSFIALILYLILRKNAGFTDILSLTGAISGGISGLMLIYMHKQSKFMQERKPEYRIKVNIILYVLLILMYLSGIIYAIWDFIF